MGNIFEDTFPGAKAMLENEIAQNRAMSHKPWRVTSLILGERVVDASFDTEAEARAHLANVLTTCAPFVRDVFGIEHRP